jgi:hypothetical protein
MTAQMKSGPVAFDGASFKICPLRVISPIRVLFKEADDYEVTESTQAAPDALRTTKFLAMSVAIFLPSMGAAFRTIVLMIDLRRFGKWFAAQSATLLLVFQHPFIFALAHAIGINTAIFLFARGGLTFPSPAEDRTIQIPFSRRLELNPALRACLWRSNP